jgi:hypothetical protein
LLLQIPEQPVPETGEVPILIQGGYLGNWTVVNSQAQNLVPARSLPQATLEALITDERERPYRPEDTRGTQGLEEFVVAGSG